MESDAYTRFVILLSMNEGRAFTEDLIKEHVRHLRELDQQGKLILCGPFIDYKGGMVIIQAESYEEADQIARRDPFVSSGTESYELRTWELSNEENNHLGAG
ncbi:YciI family protein [Gorillibacterium timonense]|uniref:YciI family protein n=1 Tax=Gorillibacterium timonense TaxID=1689269 RepID=UPI0009E87EA6|nr:YciI family protein [Gorillibacterium timonense]